MSTVAVLGNHIVPYCTEAELAWTLEDMGYGVLRFQENRDRTEDIFRQCSEREIDLLIYVHTHGWETPGGFDIEGLIDRLRTDGIKTASFHLDLYWGLNISDRRQDRIGQHPFWHTDRVFTADGGHADNFLTRGVNHHWLPPAVAKRHCFRGVPQQKYLCDIAFVGSKNYHPEYPFRGHLIAWLEERYGRRFKRFNGDAGGVVREGKLNDLYASAKIVVGDSCFAGAPYYWSDRVPETLGRGGFLLHPASQGLLVDGLDTFEAGNLNELGGLIDFYLYQEDERAHRTQLAMADVVKRHTYHNRMAELLTVMGVLA